MRELLRSLLDAGLAAVTPERCLPGFIPPPPAGLTLLGAAGKAAASMSAAFLKHYPGPVTGIAVFPYGHGLGPGDQLPGIRVMEAAHPVPDRAALDAGAAMLELAHAAGERDRFVLLVSGGASSLLEAPRSGLQLADLQQINRCLLDAGAAIGDINAVRRRLSLIKGGGLAVAAAPAEILVLAISDVPGDLLADIGSGPCCPDPGSVAQARDVLLRYHCETSSAVNQVLEKAEPLNAAHPAFRRVTGRIIARAADALAAIAALAREQGYQPVLLGDDLQAPAETLAAEHAQLALAHRRAGERVALISGGEASSPLRRTGGRGGRNTTYLLRLAIELDAAPGIWALAADSDGIDGSGEQAGAMLAPDSLLRATSAGLDASGYLANSNSGAFFGGLNDLVVTGPTRTNVNDLRIILVNPG